MADDKTYLALADEHQWKSFNDLSQIGITAGSETIMDIIVAMPEGSDLSYEIRASQHNHDAYPYPTGTITIKKYSDSACDIEHVCSANNEYRGTWRMYAVGSANTFILSDWIQVYDAVNPPTAAETGAVAKTGDTMTGPLIVERESYPKIHLKQLSEGLVGKFEISDAQEVLMGIYNNDETEYCNILLKLNPDDVKSILGIATNSGYYSVYGEHNKPTASDVDAVPTTRKVNGKALSADITLGASDVGAAASSHNHSASDITSGTLSVARGGTGKSSWTANRLIYPSAATTLAQLAFPTTAGSFLRQGTSGAPYWSTPSEVLNAIGAASSGHTHTASDVGALPLSGGVSMTGELPMNGNPIILSPYENWNGGAYNVIDETDNGFEFRASYATVTRAVTFNNTNKELNKAIQLWDSPTQKMYNVFGEHNKPSGTYNGNGSSQTIDTGGLGDVILVQLTGSGGGFALVTKSGAIGKLNSNNSVFALADTEAKFIDGVLTLDSSNYGVNRSGYGYNWQVL